MSDFVKKTEEILDFLSMVPSNVNEKIDVEINMLIGKSDVCGIINNKQLSIADVYTKKNSQSNWHTHSETEHLILYEGEGYTMECIDNDGVRYNREITLKKSCYILQGIPHRIKSVKSDCKSIVILIPGSKTFPKGKI